MKLDSAACGLVFLSVCSKVAGSPLPVYETPVTGPIKYLNLFFGNLLLGENNSLKGDDMVINIANPEIKTSDITSDKCSDLNIDDLNKTERAFFIAMAEKLCTLGYVTAADAISITGKSPQRVRQLFVALVNKGFLVATGQNKGRKYSLPEKR